MFNTELQLGFDESQTWSETKNGNLTVTRSKGQINIRLALMRRTSQKWNSSFKLQLSQQLEWALCRIKYLWVSVPVKLFSKETSVFVCRREKSQNIVPVLQPDIFPPSLCPSMWRSPCSFKSARWMTTLLNLWHSSSFCCFLISPEIHFFSCIKPKQEDVSNENPFWQRTQPGSDEGFFSLKTEIPTDLRRQELQSHRCRSLNSRRWKPQQRIFLCWF